ncbi:His/Gly/Thr/Pro-type tRNA ligase C-terminal domain-containing protein [Candidatus Omnitrophota bacterium]
MRRAEKLGARFVVIFGEEEIKRNKVVLKDMSTGEQEEVDIKSLAFLSAWEGLK